VVRALFDTNVLIDFLQGRHEAAAELERWDDRAISIVNWMEVMVGATEAVAAQTGNFLGGFRLILVDEPIAALAVDLRRRYRLKLPDAIVWASARQNDRVLVTRDQRDFPADEVDIRAPYVLS
jgi:predicted nucleic acid-binding protein